MSDRNWKEYIEALVRRGEILLDMEFLDNWSKELKIMNRGKEGARFIHSFIHSFSYPEWKKRHGWVKMDCLLNQLYHH